MKCSSSVWRCLRARARVCVCAQIEAEKYCPFTTVGSYCLIQDTKLSRFTTNGPLHAAKDYVTHYPHDFRAHRLIEPFYTQHAYGCVRDAYTHTHTRTHESRARRGMYMRDSVLVCHACLCVCVCVHRYLKRIGKKDALPPN